MTILRNTKYLTSQDEGGVHFNK